MKDDESLRGHWWLPGAIDRAGFGFLDLDSGDWSLHIGHSLVGPSATSWFEDGDDQDIVRHTIHGITEAGEPVTLLNCFLINGRHQLAAMSTLEQWAVGSYVIGDHISGEHDRFDVLRIRIAPTIEWLGRPIRPKRSDVDGGLTFDAMDETYGPVQLIDASLTLQVWHRFDHSGALTADAALEIRPASTIEMRQAERRYATPLTEMISFVTAGYAELLSIEFDQRGSDGETTTSVLRRKWTRPRDRQWTTERLRMLLPAVRIDRPVETFIADWLTMHARYSTTLSMLTVPERAPFMFADTQLHTAFLALEDFQATKFGAQVDKPEHDDRVRRLVAAAPPDLRDWAASVLPGRSTKGLRRRLREVLNHAGSTGAQITEAVPKFVERACAARNGVAHPSPSEPEKGMEFYVLHRSLRWIVRHCLLLELGYSEDETTHHMKLCMPFQDDLRNFQYFAKSTTV